MTTFINLANTMHNMKALLLAQGKGKMTLFFCFALLCAISNDGSIVPVMAQGSSAEPELHSAAKRVVRPRHRAPDLLAVVKQPDIRANHQKLADTVLRALPRYCRESLQNLYVSYDPKNTNRGLGGESTIFVTGLVPDKEFMALITHECGHVADLGGLKGTMDAGMTEFFDGTTPIYANDVSLRFYRISWANAKTRKAGSKEKDFASGYATSDAFEDFAEAFAFYALQEKEFARLAKSNVILAQKYAFMRDVVFADSAPVGEGSFVRRNTVPWDVTRLPYEWHAKR